LYNHTINAKKENPGGFTLVEVIVAAVILTFSTWGLFQTVNLGYTLIHDIRELLVVTSVLERQMEIERNKVLNHVDSRSFDPNAYYGQTILSSATGAVIVEQYGSVSTTESRKVTISINWSPRLKPSKTINKRISSIITKNGINYL